jgi:hypothetical protein
MSSAMPPPPLEKLSFPQLPQFLLEKLSFPHAGSPHNAVNSNGPNISNVNTMGSPYAPVNRPSSNVNTMGYVVGSEVSAEKTPIEKDEEVDDTDELPTCPWKLAELARAACAANEKSMKK